MVVQACVVIGGLCIVAWFLTFVAAGSLKTHPHVKEAEILAELQKDAESI